MKTKMSVLIFGPALFVAACLFCAGESLSISAIVIFTALALGLGTAFALKTAVQIGAGKTTWLFNPESVTHDDKGNWKAIGTATQISLE